jgi:hypothetical protein
MTRQALSILGAALTLSAVPAFAQQHERSVRQQLALASAAIGPGYVRVGDYTGYLHEGRTSHTNVRLEGGRTYIIVGACDDDCGDLDLELTGVWGVRAIDLEYDALPHVAVDNRYTTNNTVVVTMEHCAIEPCAYGFAVFRSR